MQDGILVPALEEVRVELGGSGSRKRKCLCQEPGLDAGRHSTWEGVGWGSSQAKDFAHEESQARPASVRGAHPQRLEAGAAGG